MRGRLLDRAHPRHRNQTSRTRAGLIGAGVVAVARDRAPPDPRRRPAATASRTRRPCSPPARRRPARGRRRRRSRSRSATRTPRAAPPTSIEVAITGVGQFAMSGPGSGFDGGVTFVVSRTLPAGSWDYGFKATSGTGAGEETVFLGKTSPGKVVITAPPPPPPPPPPTPPPTPKPTPKPTPHPRRPRRRRRPRHRRPPARRRRRAGATPAPTAPPQPPAGRDAGPGRSDRPGRVVPVDGGGHRHPASPDPRRRPRA